MSRTAVLSLALGVSLTINLLVLGFVIGRNSVGSEGAAERRAAPMEWAAQKLEPGTQRLVRQQLRKRLREVRPIRRDMQAAKRAVQRAITADEYSAKELESALAELRDASARYQTLIHSSLVQVSQGLTKEQRIAVARAAIDRAQTTRIPRDQ
ncbi:MAG: periplasmic heavy metal sensor [Pseudomonadota bacterium]